MSPVGARSGSRFEFYFKSSRLLRKGESRKQRRAAAALLAEFREAVKENVELFELECFKGPVSVFLHIYAPEGQVRPQLPPIAKAYIDGLQGLVFADDRQVAHLVVRQDSLAHPLMDGHSADERQDAPLRDAGVFIEVESVDDYTARYDRCFRNTFWSRGPSPWKGTWGVVDEMKLNDLRRKVQASGHTSTPLLRMQEEKKLLDGALADIDRPGPLPSVTGLLHQLLPISRLHLALRRHAGATLVLPLRGQGTGTSAEWRQDIDSALDEFAATRAGLPLEGFVGLDIAVRGESAQGKDLDNLAHSLLVPVEEKLCVRRGTVIDYRAYEAVGEPQGVQLRILDHLSFMELERLLHETERKVPLTQRLEAWAERAASERSIAS